MINYNNGKIYKIEPIVEHEEHEIYIGSTTKRLLCQRMAAHRNGYKRWLGDKSRKVQSYDLFEKYGVDNCVISLIELVNVNTSDELHAREKFYIQSQICLNKHIPLRTKNEYYEANKEHIISKSKNYSENNKEKVSETKKKYYETNKEDINNYKKEWYEKKKMSTPIITYICQCGSEIREKEKTRHEKTIKHQNYINSLQK